jgi:outer membrane immunogenic protein
MIKQVSVAALAVVALGTSVHAADLDIGTSYTPSPALPGYSWTGAYLGLHAGYGWGEHSPGLINFYNAGPTFFGSVEGLRAETHGVVAGGHGGYNWQFTNFVIGAEIDWSNSTIKGNVADPVNHYTAHGRIDWFSTARLRFGYAVVPSVLVYGTGGLSFGRAKTALDDLYGTKHIWTSDAQMHFGWAGGGGIEWAFARSFTVRVEYLHVDLGSKTYRFSESSPGWALISTNTRVTADTVRAGADFKW